jgi:hypothetical protein
VEDNDYLTDEEVERRLDELRNRLNANDRPKRSTAAEPLMVVLRSLCYVVAAIVFVVALILFDFINQPVEASILALLCAAAAFCITSLIVWAVKKFRSR